MWLCDIINEDDNCRDKSKLLKYLFEKEYIWVISMDENRAGDGIWQRREFLSSNGYSLSSFADKPCSVLEMLVALSIRIEDSVMYDWEEGDRTGFWFWHILDNLGLGEEFDDYFDRQKVDKIIDIFLNRSYVNRGPGCPFFMSDLSPKEFENFKKEELWTQVLDYLRDAFSE